MLPLLLLACQAPFGTDRHDLVGFRVAALSAEVAAGGAEPRAAVVVDGRMWADELPELRWYRVEDADELEALDASEEPIATGPSPVLTDLQGTLGLIATHSGEERRALLPLPSAPPPTVSVATAALPLELDRVEGDELALEARGRLEATPATEVPVGGFARLTAEVDASVRTRWMATGGTFLELDAHTADWAAGHLLLDDGELEERSVDGAGAVVFVVLALADEATAWASADLWVGDAPPRVRVGGLSLPVDAAVDGPLVGTLAADDDAPVGLALEGVEAAPDPLPSVDPYGTEALDCAAPVSGPFDPVWLVEGLCARGAVVGARVVVEP